MMYGRTKKTIFDTDPTGSTFTRDDYRNRDPTKIYRLPLSQLMAPAYSNQHDAWDTRTTEFYREGLRRQEQARLQCGVERYFVEKAKKRGGAGNWRPAAGTKLLDPTRNSTAPTGRRPTFLRKGQHSMRGAFAKSPTQVRCQGMAYAPRYPDKVQDYTQSHLPQNFYSFSSSRTQQRMQQQPQRAAFGQTM